MTSATELPTRTSLPAAGVCVMTRPAAIVALVAVLIAPTVRPALVIVLVALACAVLITEGTSTCGGPLETTIATELPVTTSVPADGVWLMIDPAVTTLLDADVTAPTESPAAAIALAPALSVRFTTDGTATCGRPEETTNATVLP